MVRKRIIWSSAAENQLQDTLDFFKHRNKSKIYGKKLLKKINTSLDRLPKHLLIGKKSNIENIHYIVVWDYLIFYEISHNNIEVVAFWDARQDPEKLVY